jgi:hypothetical protein
MYLFRPLKEIDGSNFRTWEFRLLRISNIPNPYCKEETPCTKRLQHAKFKFSTLIHNKNFNWVMGLKYFKVISLSCLTFIYTDCVFSPNSSRRKKKKKKKKKRPLKPALAQFSKTTQYGWVWTFQVSISPLSCNCNHWFTELSVNQWLSMMFRLRMRGRNRGLSTNREDHWVISGKKWERLTIIVLGDYAVNS